MKLVTFEQRKQSCIGLLVADEQILPLQQAQLTLHGEKKPCFNDMLSLLQAGDSINADIAALQQNASDEQLIPLVDVNILAPLPRPESIRDCMAFEEHIINCIRKVGLKKLAACDRLLERLLGRKASLAYRLNKAWYERPVYYKSNRFSVVGPEADIQIPDYADCLDYELEWGIIIGKQGKNIRPENAGEYIAGYTIFNDFSARDMQMKEQKARLGPAKGKDFDTGNAIGPVIVTPDELPDPYNLNMSARINGELVSQGSTGDMYWTFEDIITYISKSETLYPGEFIGSGTCSNKNSSGCGLEHGRFLKPGDNIELEVEGIGRMKNNIVAADPA